MPNKISNNRDYRSARNYAREKLIAAGYKPGQVRTAEGIAKALEQILGRQRDCSIDEFVREYLSKFQLHRPAREPRKWKDYVPSAQWEINVARAKQAQPKLWTPNNIGNGSELHHGYGRGQ